MLLWSLFRRKKRKHFYNKKITILYCLEICLRICTNCPQKHVQKRLKPSRLYETEQNKSSFPFIPRLSYVQTQKTQNTTVITLVFVQNTSSVLCHVVLLNKSERKSLCFVDFSSCIWCSIQTQNRFLTRFPSFDRPNVKKPGWKSLLTHN